MNNKVLMRLIHLNWLVFQLKFIVIKVLQPITESYSPNDAADIDWTSSFILQEWSRGDPAPCNPHKCQISALIKSISLYYQIFLSQSSWKRLKKHQLVAEKLVTYLLVPHFHNVFVRVVETKVAAQERGSNYFLLKASETLFGRNFMLINWKVKITTSLFFVFTPNQHDLIVNLWLFVIISDAQDAINLNDNQSELVLMLPDMAAALVRVTELSRSWVVEGKRFFNLDCHGVMTPSSGPPISTIFLIRRKFSLQSEGRSADPDEKKCFTWISLEFNSSFNQPQSHFTFPTKYGFLSFKDKKLQFCFCSAAESFQKSCTDLF